MIIAHQGGWDELLIFIVPVIAMLWALRWAERKSRSVDVTEVDGGGAPGSDVGQEGSKGGGEHPDGG